MIAGAERQEMKSGLPIAGAAGHSPGKTARKIWKLVAEIGAEWYPGLGLAHALLSMLPPRLGSRVRSSIYRLLGFPIGRNVCILGNITFDGEKDLYGSLAIGDECLINTPLHLNLGAKVTIGNRVGIGHHTVLITDTHEIGPAYGRMGIRKSLPITIEDGVWICAGVTILPGVTIGSGSVVAAGAVVDRNVPPDTMVAGVPARIIKLLPSSSPLPSRVMPRVSESFRKGLPASRDSDAGRTPSGRPVASESPLPSQTERDRVSIANPKSPLPSQRERVRVRVVPPCPAYSSHPVYPFHPCSSVQGGGGD